MRHLCLLLATILVARPAQAQRIDWHTTAVLYGDNTEFFTPYRTGETILGGQLVSWIQAATGRRTSVSVGLFADRRWGSEEFTDSLKPILSVAYRGRNSTAILGSLDNQARHGLLTPLMVSTRELTTPIEYGLQWIERRDWFSGEAWVNWQRLNTLRQREAFEAGAVIKVRPIDHIEVGAQHLWSHHGGQLYQAGVPVTNNRVTALGLTLSDNFPVVGLASASYFHLWSEGHLDPNIPVDIPTSGTGNFWRGSVMPWSGWTFAAIHWRGIDFHADAGDANFGSLGKVPGFYRSHRKYTELSIVKRIAPRRERIKVDAEVRWHRIDDEKSEAFFNTSWEISYRLVVKAPISIRLR